MKFSRHHFRNLTSISTADPAVFTLTDHELTEGDTIVLETTGSLPTGLLVKTKYYVVYNGLTSSTFQVASSQGGTPIATTADGSGTQSFLKRNNAGIRPMVQDNR